MKVEYVHYSMHRSFKTNSNQFAGFLALYLNDGSMTDPQKHLVQGIYNGKPTPVIEHLKQSTIVLREKKILSPYTFQISGGSNITTNIYSYCLPRYVYSNKCLLCGVLMRMDNDLNDIHGKAFLENREKPAATRGF